MSFLYHHGKANLVADALSRTTMGSVSCVEEEKEQLVENVHRLDHFGVRLLVSPNGGFVVHYNSDSSLVVEVKSKQYLEHLLMQLKESVLNKLKYSFSQEGGGLLSYQGRLCVPDIEDFRKQIQKETHGSRYSIYLGATKMYHDLREVYWFDDLKKDIAEFVHKCQNFQQVKNENLQTGGLTQIMDVPT
ncbi:uncharacterized protein [Solanum lycopersicum]|uniref:uncharacterized protein n=1 Tax=Solanum lycopersicum TaxID=4081 RepID=UPI00374A3041